MQLIIQPIKILCYLVLSFLQLFNLPQHYKPALFYMLQQLYARPTFETESFCLVSTIIATAMNGVLRINTSKIYVNV